MAIKQMISTTVLWLVTTVSKLRVGFVLFAQVYSVVIRRSRCSQMVGRSHTLCVFTQDFVLSVFTFTPRRKVAWYVDQFSVISPEY